MVLIVAEETRAAAYRAQETRRCAAIAARERALHGNASLRATLNDNWEPLVLALRERGMTSDLDCIDESERVTA